MLSAVVTAATAGSITGMPSTRLNGSASPKKERQPKNDGLGVRFTHQFLPAGQQLFKSCFLCQPKARLPFKLTAAICPMRSGLTPSVRRNIFFSGRRASSASITPKLRHTLSAAMQEACAPPITGMRNASRQASITGVAEAVQNNGVKTGVLPVCRKLHNFGCGQAQHQGRVKLHPGVLRAHHGKLRIWRRVFFRMRQRKAISSCVMP